MERKEATLRKFGKHINALRLQKKLSIQELAAASGLESRHIQQIETGKVNVLFTTIVALATGLGIPPDELLQTL